MYKKYYFIFKDTSISYFKTKEAAASLTSPQQVFTTSKKISKIFDIKTLQIKLKGAEVVPDVSISEEKYVIKLFIPGIEGMQEYWLRCDTVSFQFQFVCFSIKLATITFY